MNKKMDAEKLKKEIDHTVEMAQSIRDEMLENFTHSNTPSETMIQALEIVTRLSALQWYLEYIGKEVSAV